MKNVFLIADLHFGDSDMVTLVKEDGLKSVCSTIKLKNWKVLLITPHLTPPPKAYRIRL
jgi:calcineurin-like phosphoesterase family protein